MQMNQHFYPSFFLGLLEGDGSIQVNSWKKTYLQFRIIIKLKQTPENYRMCVTLRDVLGIMNLHMRRGYVILVEDHKQKLPKIMQIIDTYGLITTHRKKQYKLFKYCFYSNVKMSEYVWIKQNFESWIQLSGYLPMDQVFPGKGKSYSYSMGLNSPHPDPSPYGTAFSQVEPSSICQGHDCFPFQLKASQIQSLEHFPNWLCGFVEAEGCFSIRKTKQHSFSIAQKQERETLLAICNFWHIPNRIQQKSNALFLVETYNRRTIRTILDFFEGKCLNFPGRKLLGAKAHQCKAFAQSFSKSFQ